MEVILGLSAVIAILILLFYIMLVKNKRLSKELKQANKVVDDLTSKINIDRDVDKQSENEIDESLLEFMREK